MRSTVKSLTIKVTEGINGMSVDNVVTDEDGRARQFHEVFQGTVGSSNMRARMRGCIERIVRDVFPVAKPKE